MPNGEQPFASRREEFEKAETSLEAVKQTPIGDLSLEELQALVAKRQELLSRKENIFDADYEEALGMEERRNASLAEEKAKSEAADAAQAEAVLANLQAGAAPVESRQEDTQNFEEAQKLLESLHEGARSAIGEIDMSMGRIAPAAGEKINKLKRLLPKVDQRKLAEEFWGATCAQLRGNEAAYQVYLALKGSEFSKRFKELESARLEEGGYGKFVI